MKKLAALSLHQAARDGDLGLLELHTLAVLEACRPKRGARWPQLWAARANRYLVTSSRWWHGLAPYERDTWIVAAILDVARRRDPDRDPMLAALTSRNLAANVLLHLEAEARREDGATLPDRRQLDSLTHDGDAEGFEATARLARRGRRTPPAMDPATEDQDPTDPRSRPPRRR